MKVYDATMRIGEVARRLETHTPTIRYYEQVGVVATPARRSSGYRDYGEDDVARIAAVLALRRLDVPLDEIRELAGTCFDHRCATNTDRLLGLVERRSAKVHRRIDELHSLADQLAELRRRLTNDGRTMMIELTKTSMTEEHSSMAGCDCGCDGEAGCSCGCACCKDQTDDHAQHVDAVAVLAQAPSTGCDCGSCGS